MFPARMRPLRLSAPIAALLAAVFMAEPAAGQIPSPSNHTAPCGFVLVPPGLATAAFDFEVVARDLANNPIAGAEVRVDFTGCGADARPATLQPPGLNVDCPTRSVFAFTDAQGRVTFRIVGGSSGAPPQAGSGPGCAQIYIDGVLATNAHVGVLDLDGAGGLMVADLAIWLSDFFGPTYAARSDYDYTQSGCVEYLSTSDFSIWLGAFFAQSAVYGDPLCGP